MLGPDVGIEVGAPDGTPEGFELGFDEELESPWEQLIAKLRAGTKAPGMVSCSAGS